MLTSCLVVVSQTCRHDRRFPEATKPWAELRDCPRTWSAKQACRSCGRLLAARACGRSPLVGDEARRDGGATTLWNDDGNGESAQRIAIANYARLRLQRAVRQLSKSTSPTIMLIDVP